MTLLEPYDRHATGTARPDQLRMFEIGLVLAALLIASGAFRTFLAAGSDDREAGSLLFQLLTLSIYGSAGVVVVLRGLPAWFPGLLRAAWPVLVLTGLAVLSTLWSDAPSATFRRATALLLTTGFAFYIVASFSPREFIRLLAAAFVLFFVAALVAAAMPGDGITPSGLHQGAWRGFTGQKNEFGRTCGLALTFFLILVVIVGPRARRLVLAAAAMALALLLLSTSKTPITATTVGLGGTMIARILLHGRIGRAWVAAEIRLALFIVIAGTIFISVFWLVPLIVEAMGRDLTLSGRTELWKWAIGIGGETPWLGSGYRGFWNDSNTKYFFEYFAWQRSADGELSDSYTGPTHAHSGYVDLWLELGWIGCALYGLLIVNTFARIAASYRAGQFEVGLCLSAITWFLIAYAFTAKSIMQQGEDLWVIFLVFYLYAARVGAEGAKPGLSSVRSAERERRDVHAV